MFPFFCFHSFCLWNLQAVKWKNSGGLLQLQWMEYNCILRVLLNKSLQSESLRALFIIDLCYSFLAIAERTVQFRAEFEIIAELQSALSFRKTFAWNQCCSIFCGSRNPERKNISAHEKFHGISDVGNPGKFLWKPPGFTTHILNNTASNTCKVSRGFMC